MRVMDIFSIVILVFSGVTLFASVTIRRSTLTASEKLLELMRRVAVDQDKQFKATSDSIRDFSTSMAERESNFNMLRTSMENAMAAERREWAEERSKLLDRIQVPGLAAAMAFDKMSPATGASSSDEDIDKVYAGQPESVVPWDADLAPIPGIDPEE